MSEPATTSTWKIGVLSETEIMSKVKEIHDLTIDCDKGRNRWFSDKTGEYPLTSPGFIDSLTKGGFTWERGKDEVRKNTIYLAGHSRQTSDFFENDCWSWDVAEENPYLTVSFFLYVDERKRGIVAIPQIWGNCKGGACHQPTIDKLAIAIGSHFTNTHSLLKRMTQVSEYPVIGWNELDLSGIRSLNTLFQEMYGHNELICALAREHVSLFNPNPYHIQEYHFVREQFQRELMNKWQAQLQEFKGKLV